MELFSFLGISGTGALVHMLLFYLRYHAAFSEVPTCIWNLHHLEHIFGDGIGGRLLFCRGGETNDRFCLKLIWLSFLARAIDKKFHLCA